MVYKAAIFVGTSNAASSLLQGYMSGWTNSLFDPSGGLSVVKDLAVTAIVML